MTKQIKINAVLKPATKINAVLKPTAKVEVVIENVWRPDSGELPQYPASMIVETKDRMFISQEELLRISGFTFEQISASLEWVIDHTLNKYPSVSVVDSAGSLVIGRVHYVSLDRIVISFSSEFSGKAFLN